MGSGRKKRKQIASAHVINKEFLSHFEAAVDNCCSPITSTAKLISIYCWKDGRACLAMTINRSNSRCSGEDTPENTLPQNSL